MWYQRSEICPSASCKYGAHDFIYSTNKYFLIKPENWPNPAYAHVSPLIWSQDKSLDHFTRAFQGSPDWGTTDLGWHPYLVNVWQAAASRITGDTTSWVAWREVGHLWVQAVSQVKSAEVCGELHVHTYTTYTQMVSMSQHSCHYCSLTPMLPSPNHITHNQKYQYDLWH